MIDSIMESRGYLPKQDQPPPAEKKDSIWNYILRYVLPIVGPTIGLVAFGQRLMDDHMFAASVLCGLALLVFLLGTWLWWGKRPRIVAIINTVAVLGFVYLDYHWINDYLTPTFVYLTPTRELIDCERRAFFVNHSGLRELQNVVVTIKDNKTGDIQEGKYSEIDPGSPNPDSPRYIWVKPSHPWDEDYIVTVTAKRARSVQQIILRSAKQTVQFAVQILVDQRKTPVVSCRDGLLPDAYTLARGATESCDNLMAISRELLNKLQPEFYVLQQPSGSVSVVRLRELPTPSNMDAQSEDRHLAEYQRAIMRSKLSKYHGTKLLILYSGGPKSLAYATEFGAFFRSIRWDVSGPRIVPLGDERLVDVQVSVSQHYWNVAYPMAADLLSSLEGVKHRKRYVYDSAIPPDLILLWVGPKSPANLNPDDCAPASLRPRLGEHNTCEIVAQTTSACPFPPQ